MLFFRNVSLNNEPQFAKIRETLAVSQGAETGPLYDLMIIGGGINGCGIARDAAGRGLSVALAEMHDLASATSSASTKLFHGGLRYLEYFELRLVREALIERETLLTAMPHISWPMRFVLPYGSDMRFDTDTPAARLLHLAMPWLKGRRPAWMIRFGLWLYDHLGGRKILPPTATLDLRTSPEGAPLQPRFSKAFEYSDCWVEDSRLVALNARDAAERGAEIMVGSRVVATERRADDWHVTIEDTETGERRTIRARCLINAAGPWVGDILHSKAHLETRENVRLVRGSPHRHPPALRSRQVLLPARNRRAHHLRHSLRDRLHPDRHHRRRPPRPLR